MNKNTKKTKIIFDLISFFEEYQYDLNMAKNGPVDLKEFDIFEKELIKRIIFFLKSKNLNFYGINSILINDYKFLKFNEFKTLYLIQNVNSKIPKYLKYFEEEKQLYFLNYKSYVNDKGFQFYNQDHYLFLEYNNPKELEYWGIFENNIFINILDNLKKCIEWSMTSIDINYQNNTYLIDLNNEEDIKKILKELKQIIFDLQKQKNNEKKDKEKIQNQIDNLTKELSIIKISIKELNKEKTIEEKNELTQNMIEAFCLFIPYGSGFLKLFKVAKSSKKLLDYKKETIEEIKAEK